MTLRDRESIKCKSFSKQISARFESRKLWRRSATVIFVIYFSAYLVWLFMIIDPDSLFLGTLFYVSELFGFILALATIMTSWDYQHRDPPPVPPQLTVDVFVTVYKEPIEIIRRTVIAAKEIDYPHTTWMLDDGKRDEIKFLAEGLGIRYLRRPDNLNAKAGNINYGLQHSAAEFVMSLDADHIPMPHALDVMLGFFTNPDVALVQTPQDYYNVDAFQYISSGHRNDLWHEQSHFYNIFQPCGDRENSAVCVGTGVVYRRSALAAVGGIPVETVTEDVHTSLVLQKAGYRVVYINEPVAYGIAAADLAEFYKTRHRWEHGNFQVLRAENILTCKGLSFRQRLGYMTMGLIYVEAWQQFLLMIIPILSLMLGLFPFQISIFNAFILSSMPVFSFLLMQEIGCGFNRFWGSQVLAMARFPVSMIAIAGAFKKKILWRTSSKSFKGEISWNLLAPQLAVLVLNLGAFIFGLCRIIDHFTFGPLSRWIYSVLTRTPLPPLYGIHTLLPKGSYSADIVLMAGFWSLYTAARAFACIHKAIYGVKNTHDFFRFRIPFPVLCENTPRHSGCITAISETWAKIVLYETTGGYHAGETILLTAQLPAGPIELKMSVEKAVFLPAGANMVLEGRLVWGTPPEPRDRLARCLYSVDWHREFMYRCEHFLTPSDIILSLLRFTSPFQKRYVAWQAALIKGKAYGILGDFSQDKRAAFLVTFEPLSPGAAYKVEIFSEDGVKDADVQIESNEPMSSLTKKGLDGAVARKYKVRL